MRECAGHGPGKRTGAGPPPIALASGGGKVLLIEMEGRQGIARLFDGPPLPYQERRVAVAPAPDTLPGGDVYALAAATGKAAEATRRRLKGRPVYDAVVMDAPPTGRIGKFLNVATEVSGLARVGPIHGHAETVESVIRSPQTAVHFVTVLEEMPVQETLDGIAEL